ncbi:hypothetical protein BZM27_06155 [Paraburkholderia steynii]|uniref:Uncharacterized protein n=1 Tax=Paraburkholderia steynii TaxID=1245441 RepID=A0A4R0XMI8_9BURK|nr:hypothetical protein BZM27_06155 [Paraburkholderia steynii]
MMKRCYLESATFYQYYGGKGVKVCDRWRDSFANFFADMGERPEGMTLDRYPDKNGDYAPGNCRWATPTEQIRNRNTTVYIEFRGLRKTMKEWADEIGVAYKTLRARIVDQGWPIDRALTTPLRIHRKHVP